MSIVSFNKFILAAAKCSYERWLWKVAIEALAQHKPDQQRRRHTRYAAAVRGHAATATHISKLQ
jgi:hypothetical protein